VDLVPHETGLRTSIKHSHDKLSEYAVLHSIGEVLQSYAKEHGLAYREVVEYLRRNGGDENSIPLSILADRRLGLLEAIVKFLKEERGLRYAKIARLLYRDSRTVWSAYANARKNRPQRFGQQVDGIRIPLEVFSDRRLGPLEALVRHLKDTHALSHAEVGRLLSRNSRTIWTSYMRAVKKTDDVRGEEQ